MNDTRDSVAFRKEQMFMRPTTKVAAIGAGVLMGASMLLAPIAFASDSAPTAAPAGYYDAAAGKTGEALKSALHDIIDDHNTLSYSEVWDGVAAADADPDKPGNVILLYTGRSEPVGGNYNREHVWAKSHGDFGTRIGPGTDLHHLRPTDPRVNSTRSNLDFDNGGKEVSGAPGNFYDSDSFEPRDEVKGDVARMILYMAVRYEGDDSYPDLEPNEKVGNGKSPYMGKLSVLMEWNAQDAPDAFEKKRNDVIYSDFQGNRNPFIDNPAWVDAIWGNGEPTDPTDPPTEDPTDPPTDPTDPPTDPTDPPTEDPTDPPASCDGTNSTPTTIKSNGIAKSSITVSDCSGKAATDSTVTVEITHPDRGELSIYLYAPDGTYYVLKRTGDSGADLSATYTVDLDGETANGKWTLSVKDYGSGATGSIDEWSISLG